MEFQLNKEAFSYYDPDKHTWVLEPGAFDILLASSSADIIQTIPVTIN